ncbi:terminase large subunit domain-containing protein [Streptomyces sp. cg35]|uniref:terminase large subunit domain-containing protein n=1 Tax=Streptomyces sp. cg35 TaxID=3421650 RepID=UPI003D16AB54
MLQYAPDPTEQVERARYLAALGDPVSMAVSVDDSFKPRPHSRLIGNALAKVAAGNAKKVLITTPPQVGKSTTAAVWGVFWWLVRNPTHHVIIASYGSELADERGRQIRKLIRTYGHLFNLYLSPDRSSVSDWRLTTGGGVRCAGMGGSLTGHPCDFLVVDDPHKNRAETDSPTVRKRVANSYSSDLVSRLSPGAPTLLILTRWHEDDLAGRLLKAEGRVEDGGEWTVIHLPALADLDLTPDGDPLGRKQGEPLSHPKIPTRDKGALLAHWYSKRSGSTPYDWGALYQGNPQPTEGALVTAELMRERTHLTGIPGPRRVGVAVDPSGGGRDQAGVIGGHIGTDKRLYWTHDRSGHMTSDQWSRAACTLAMETNASVIYVEKNFGGDQAELVVKTAWKMLREEWPDEHDGEPNPYDKIPPLVEAKSAKVGKMLRAEPVAGQIREDRIRLAEHMPELVKEWCTFQVDSSWSPGRIDASVLLSDQLLGPPSTGHAVNSPQGSRQEIANRAAQQRGGPRIGKRSYGG